MNYIRHKIPFPFIDIFFIRWKPNTVSKIHNHSKNGCYLFLLKGDIKEEIYSKEIERFVQHFFGRIISSHSNQFSKMINFSGHPQ